jgi:hypothetical protein
MSARRWQLQTDFPLWETISVRRRAWSACVSLEIAVTVLDCTP